MKGRTLVALLTTIFAALLLYDKGQEASVTPEPIASAPMPHAPTASRKPIASPHSPPRVSPQRREGGDDDHSLVPFKVSHGLAIAFGDVILGAPEDPNITEGFHEPRAPQPWDRPEIPYAIHPDLSNPERVHTAIKYFHDHTPVTFVTFEDQPDAIVFEPGEEHCLSYLGRTGGMQPIKLHSRCSWSEIVHELMHALGFVHEQSRHDRDAHLEILWDNIEEKYRDQFAIVPEALLMNIKDFPFDYRSAMLYRPEIFSKGGNALTMRSRGATAISPVTSGLSEGDIARLNRLYPGQR